MITAFQRRVYDEARKIPHGAVITYGELARRIGCGSARAVGQALRVNPFAPEVPCHRVVAADGSLTGFYGQRDAAALAKKRRLLESEGIRFASGKCVFEASFTNLIERARDAKGKDREGYRAEFIRLAERAEAHMRH